MVQLAHLSEDAKGNSAENGCLPEIDDGLACFLVNVPHNCNLLRALIFVLLIDANSINPQDPFAIRQAEIV
jgi:hypothetical protein